MKVRNSPEQGTTACFRLSWQVEGRVPRHRLFYRLPALRVGSRLPCDGNGKRCNCRGDGGCRGRGSVRSTEGALHQGAGPDLGEVSRGQRPGPGGQEGGGGRVLTKGFGEESVGFDHSAALETWEGRTGWGTGQTLKDGVHPVISGFPPGPFSADLDEEARGFVRQHRKIRIFRVKQDPQSLCCGVQKRGGRVAFSQRDGVAQGLLEGGLEAQCGVNFGRAAFGRPGSHGFMGRDLVIQDRFEDCDHRLCQNRHVLLRPCGEEGVACSAELACESYRVAEELGSQGETDGTGLGRIRNFFSTPTSVDRSAGMRRRK